MGKIMEAIFCVFYLVFTSVMGFRIIKNSNKRTEKLLFGIMTLVLVFGDAFHLVPRILAAVNKNGDYTVSLGIGKLITSITMTFFYVLLYFIYEIRYEYKNIIVKCLMLILALIRIVLCLMPGNDWTGLAPVNWGIYRNIPFVIMGIIMIMLFYIKRKDSIFKYMYIAILLSFLFYLPVVLWSDLSPMIGMLMLPKTCMYMWMVMMGNKC